MWRKIATVRNFTVSSYKDPEPILIDQEGMKKGMSFFLNNLLIHAMSSSNHPIPV